ncbi:MAG TPA: NUDIX domain-containing protein [Syntrophales bacterium]|nr:NUDIX domain-containing protein [Syntrophales bacterium]
MMEKSNSVALKKKKKHLNIPVAIATLLKHVPNPSRGLPDDVFYYISRTTPLINVDLLIKDEKGRTLLSWRDDPYAGRGWHVPGGIVRFKETLEERVKKVAQTEIGATIRFDPIPIALNQIINPDRAIRGHFVSFLYKCFFPRTFIPHNKGLSKEDVGYLKWHDHCPANLVRVQRIYKRYINPMK